MLLSLDLGKQLGYCVIDYKEGCIIDSGFKLLGKNLKYDILTEVDDVIYNFNSAYGLNGVAVEVPPYVNNFKVYRNLSMMMGVIKLYCKRNDIPFNEYNVKEWKKQVVKNGNATKQDVLDVVNNTFEFDIKDQNEADAICIGLAYMHDLSNYELKKAKEEQEKISKKGDKNDSSSN